MDANGQYVTCSHLPKLPLRLHCPIIWLRRLWRNVLRNTWTSTTAWCSQWAPINSNRLTMSCNVLHIESCWLVCCHAFIALVCFDYLLPIKQVNRKIISVYLTVMMSVWKEQHHSDHQWSHWSHEVSTLQMPLVMFLDACEHCARICQDLGSVFGSFFWIDLEPV